MKKVVSLLLVTALLIGALSACKRNEPEPEPAPPEPVTPTYDYQDGNTPSPTPSPRSTARSTT